MLRKIYRKLVPIRIRNYIIDIRENKIKSRQLKRKIIESIDQNISSGEILNLIEWLKQNPLHVFPYEFTKKYCAKKIKVFYDQERGLHYVLYADKRMYWKRNSSEEQIRQSVMFLQLEQDEQSPHYYLRAGYEPRDQAVVADLGVAEGNFSLSIIDRVKKIYLFECDPGWIEALQATFAPWKDKVVIVNEFVGNGKGCIRLDDYFGDKEIDYIKADIEGTEVSMLLGSTEILKKKVSQVVICTYHKFDDEENVKKCLALQGYICENSKGYMCYMHGDDFDKAYFRRGLVYGDRGHKASSFKN